MRLLDEVGRLREALEWFADEGHYEGTYRPGAGFAAALGLTRARAALLGMDHDAAGDVDRAWTPEQCAERAQLMAGKSDV